MLSGCCEFNADPRGTACEPDASECLCRGDAAMTNGNELDAIYWYIEAERKDSAIATLKKKVAQRALADACAEPSVAVIDTSICQAACAARLTGRLAEVNKHLLERYASEKHFSIADASKLSPDELHRLSCELAVIGNDVGIAYLNRRKLLELNNTQGGGVVHYAAAAGQEQFVKWVVGVCGADPKKQDEKGDTPCDWVANELCATESFRKDTLCRVKEFLKTFVNERAGEVDIETKDRVLAVISRMMAKSLRSVSDDESRRMRDDNLLFVSNMLHDCDLDCGFVRLDDGTPFLIDTVGGCDGAYKDIPCYITIDDKYAHGGALFPEADAANTNIVEFVALANNIAERGRFEYDPEFGFVMYTLSMPVSAIRRKGKSTLGMIYGFPVMEVDLFSEAYKEVLESESNPKRAITLVEHKLKEIGGSEQKTQVKHSEEALAAIRKFFEDKGHTARTVKFGDRLGFAGTTTGGNKEGLKNDKYDFRIEVDDEWVYSFVWLPNVVSNCHSEVSSFVARLNKELGDSCNVVVYDEKYGRILCRSQMHVIEFTKDVHDSIGRLLRHPVDILDTCSDSIQKICSGVVDAQSAIGGLMKEEGKMDEETTVK